MQDAVFLDLICFLVAGGRGRDFFLGSGLPPSVLSRIWRLADRDMDGGLNAAEFSVAMCLVHRALNGVAPPPLLPPPLAESIETLLSGTLPPMDDRHVLKCQTAFAAFKACIVTGRLGCKLEPGNQREGAGVKLEIILCSGYIVKISLLLVHHSCIESSMPKYI